MEKLHELNQIFAGNDENVENGAVASARAKFTVSDPDLTLAQVSFSSNACNSNPCRIKSQNLHKISVLRIFIVYLSLVL